MGSSVTARGLCLAFSRAVWFPCGSLHTAAPWTPLASSVDLAQSPQGQCCAVWTGSSCATLLRWSFRLADGGEKHPSMASCLGRRVSELVREQDEDDLPGTMG